MTSNRNMKDGSDISGYEFQCACREGDISVVKHYISTGFCLESYEKDDFVLAAVKSGNTKLIDHLLSLGCTLQKISQWYIDCSSDNCLQLIEYLVSNNHLDRKTSYTTHVAGSGNMTVLKYLHDNGFELFYSGFIRAIETGHLVVAKYYVKNNFVPDANDNEPIETANAHGHVHIVNYFKSLGYNLHKESTLYLNRIKCLDLINARNLGWQDWQEVYEDLEGTEMILKCDSCDKMATMHPELGNWWIDPMCDIKQTIHSGKVFDLCDTCRSLGSYEEPDACYCGRHADNDDSSDEDSDNIVTCERCCDSGKYGWGKWNCGGNMITCHAWMEYKISIDLCTTCHHKLHYNK